MATLTNEQIEQQKQQSKELAEEVKTPATEETQELSEDDLDKAAGGWGPNDCPEIPLLSRPSIPEGPEPKEKPQPFEEAGSNRFF